MSIDRLNKDGRKVIDWAFDERFRYHDGRAHPIHILLAVTNPMYAEQECIAAQVLAALGVKRNEIHVLAEEVHAYQSDFDFYEVLQAAVDEAAHQNHQSDISSAYLLLGLLHEPDGEVVALLNEHGVTLESARAMVADEFS